jgi:hypothetical protein
LRESPQLDLRQEGNSTVTEKDDATGEERGAPESDEVRRLWAATDALRAKLDTVVTQLERERDAFRDELRTIQRIAKPGHAWPYDRVTAALNLEERTATPGLEERLATLIEDGRTVEARALARGTRWEATLAPPTATPAATATGRGDMPANLRWLQRHGHVYAGRGWVALKDGALVAYAPALHDLQAAIADRGDGRDLMVTCVDTTFQSPADDDDTRFKPIADALGESWSGELTIESLAADVRLLRALADGALDAQAEAEQAKWKAERERDHAQQAFQALRRFDGEVRAALGAANNESLVDVARRVRAQLHHLSSERALVAVWAKTLAAAVRSTAEHVAPSVRKLMLAWTEQLERVGKTTEAQDA